jgi:hypothetical protein
VSKGFRYPDRISWVTDCSSPWAAFGGMILEVGCLALQEIQQNAQFFLVLFLRVAPSICFTFSSLFFDTHNFNNIRVGTDSLSYLNFEEFRSRVWGRFQVFLESRSS